MLVPQSKLEPAFAGAANRAFEAGVDIHEMGFEARRKAFDAVLAKDFGVSLTTMTIRLEYDGLVAKRPRA